jgi:hypothetical protein
VNLYPVGDLLSAPKPYALLLLLLCVDTIATSDQNLPFSSPLVFKRFFSPVGLILVALADITIVAQYLEVCKY